MPGITTRKRIIIAGTIVIAVAAILGLAYGIYLKTTPYRTVTANDQVCSYSLTYPNHYKKDGPRYDDMPPFGGSRLSLTGEEITVSYGDLDWTFSSGGISVIVYRPDSLPDSAEAYVEGHLEGMSRWSGFELIEKKPIIVSGVEGFEVVFTYKHFIKAVGFKIERWIILLYEGRIWNIELSCSADLYEQFNADFEYILNSFVILK